MRSVFRVCKIVCLTLVVIWAPAALVANRTGLPGWARMPLAVLGPVLFVAAFVFDLMADPSDRPAPAVRLAREQGLKDAVSLGLAAPGIWRLTARDRDGRRNLYEVDTRSGTARFIRPTHAAKRAKAPKIPHGHTHRRRL